MPAGHVRHTPAPPRTLPGHKAAHPRPKPDHSFTHRPAASCTALPKQGRPTRCAHHGPPTQLLSWPGSPPEPVGVRGAIKRAPAARGPSRAVRSRLARVCQARAVGRPSRCMAISLPWRRFLSHDRTMFSQAEHRHFMGAPRLGLVPPRASSRTVSRLPEGRSDGAAPSRSVPVELCPSARWGGRMGHAQKMGRRARAAVAVGQGPMGGPPHVAGSGLPGWPPPRPACSKGPPPSGGGARLKLWRSHRVAPPHSSPGPPGRRRPVGAARALSSGRRREVLQQPLTDRTIAGPQESAPPLSEASWRRLP